MLSSRLNQSEVSSPEFVSRALPGVYVLLSEHEPSQEKQQQQDEGTQGIGHDQVSGQSSDASEEGHCIVVNEEGEEPEHEHPACSQGLSLRDNVFCWQSVNACDNQQRTTISSTLSGVLHIAQKLADALFFQDSAAVTVGRSVSA